MTCIEPNSHNLPPHLFLPWPALNEDGRQADSMDFSDAAVERPIVPGEPVEPPIEVTVSASGKLDTAMPPPPEEPVRKAEPAIAATADADPLPLPRPRPAKVLVATNIEPSSENLSARRSGAKHVIVLDPGHGGIDPGASSKGLKTREKDVVLEFCTSAQEATGLERQV